ncbi:6-N-hydroxylaminopurine resistance protein [Klebsiella pneumoniae]|uniref:6-N-hydroxylaminopurine resistance protein n=1 Tax=Klebsiella pneumoniae TaxID=573 RepID=A0A2X3GFU3_KLEPN|nr:6-N-hydroxylaminopurine resistance protein [Klebsiella pneumoniae]
MHYPVNVFVGKIRDYAGSRPSAIGKIQVDGELQLGDLGLNGDQQAEKKIHGGPDRALCHYPREHYADWIRDFPQQAERFCAPAFGEKPLHHRAYRAKRLYRRYLSLGRGADPGHPAAIAVLQAQLSFCDQ